MKGLIRLGKGVLWTLFFVGLFCACFFLTQMDGLNAIFLFLIGK